MSYVIKHSNGYKSAYMLCQGDFDKSVLQDELVTFAFGATLTGIYNHSQNPNFEGVARYDGYTLQCYGNIYNEKEHYAISTKSNKWSFDLKFEIEGNDKFWVDMENTASTNMMEKAIITDGFSDERGVDVNPYNRDNAVDELCRYIC